MTDSVMLHVDINLTGLQTRRQSHCWIELPASGWIEMEMRP